ncbi:hypothetical protein ACH4PU_32875 [Streptomyces sp. NPDC021100]|uniref:hypothetical protein n=1 Tax=Streptomyces sp. NPDC021100 TaxID=3365114 RepID=UPI0037B24338
MDRQPDPRVAAQGKLDDLAEMMTRHGWAVSRQYPGAAEARVEGERRGGAAVMATARLTDKGWKIRYYVIGSEEDGWTRWAGLKKRSTFLEFIRSSAVDADTRLQPLHSHCRCAKKHQATRWRALRRLAGIQLHRISADDLKMEKRVYRCPHDARRWHLTSKQEHPHRRDTWQGKTVSL